MIVILDITFHGDYGVPKEYKMDEPLDLTVADLETVISNTLAPLKDGGISGMDSLRRRLVFDLLKHSQNK